MRALPAVGALLLAAACSPAGGSGSPGASPASPSAIAGIEHPTGTTDVVLRMSTGGGFVAPGFLASEVPEFTLYGDGTLVFRDPADAPASGESGLFRLGPLKTARLDEAGIQDLLAFAIGPSGLGIARAQYDPCCVADAPTTTFTLKAGGLDKAVAIGALGFDEPQPGPDTAARAAFKALRDRLVDLDRGGALATTIYRPVAYRGILLDAAQAGPPAGPSIDWPWTTFGPDEFVAPADPNSPALRTRTLSGDDVDALGLPGLEGGVQGVALRTADGRVWQLSLRPLLPGESR